jgi:hypothetical protein
MVRGGNNGANLLDVDIIGEVSLHGVDFAGGEGSSVGGILEDEARSRLIALGVKAPRAVLIFKGRPAASDGFA